ncbi:MAG: ATP-binding protein [Propionibacteriaceae bacterium]|nr:ATP-binding protein [Propionibacteriaceae bacterium]
MPADHTFVPAFGNKPKHLVGRDQVIADFRNGLDGPPGHQDRATLCLGLRGMGKTALLLEFASHAQERGFVAVKATARPGRVVVSG